MGSRGAGSGKKSNGLSKGDNDAIEFYISGYGMETNNILRGRYTAQMTQGEKEWVKDMDRLTDKSVKQKTLYRSVDAEAVFGKMSDIEYSNLIGGLVYNDKSRFSQQAVSKFADRAKGKVISDKGFISTTKDYEVG